MAHAYRKVLWDAPSVGRRRIHRSLKERRKMMTQPEFPDTHWQNLYQTIYRKIQEATENFSKLGDVSFAIDTWFQAKMNSIAYKVEDDIGGQTTWVCVVYLLSQGLDPINNRNKSFHEHEEFLRKRGLVIRGLELNLERSFSLLEDSPESPTWILHLDITKPL